LAARHRARRRPAAAPDSAEDLPPHMGLFRHLLMFALYSAAAVAVALLAPDYLPEIGVREAPLGAYLIGALVFVLGLLLHEVAARLEREAWLADQILALQHAHSNAGQELHRVGNEAVTFRETLETRERKSQREVGNVVAEVKVLQSLIEQLYASRSAADQPAAEAAAVDTAPAPRPTEGQHLVIPQAAGASGGATVPMPPIARNLDDRAVLDILREGLQEERVELALQPIVSLPQRKRRFYECFSRVRAGHGLVIMPEQYIELAERAGLITAIDNMLLFRCIQLLRKIRHRNLDIGFFCNISQHTLADRAFFRDFVRFMQDNAELASSIIFEFPQRAITSLGDNLRRDLDELGRLGFRYSLDQVTQLDLDADWLSAQRFRFVKIDAARLLAPDATIDPIELKRRLDARGIDLIVEKIETEAMLVELLDLRIDFGQGYLFGEPRLSRPESHAA
jgi:cyclic-di-GMP phosphodiesterase TipF (flagellum assembly factor)